MPANFAKSPPEPSTLLPRFRDDPSDIHRRVFQAGLDPGSHQGWQRDKYSRSPGHRAGRMDRPAQKSLAYTRRVFVDKKGDRALEFLEQPGGRDGGPENPESLPVRNGTE